MVLFEKYDFLTFMYKTDTTDLHIAIKYYNNS